MLKFLRNPCWCSASVMLSVIQGNKIDSRSLATGESKEIGLNDLESLASFPGLSNGMILAVFHMSGMASVLSERLKSLVRYSVDLGPRCLIMIADMPSGPMALDGLTFFMAISVSVFGICSVF